MNTPQPVHAWDEPEGIAPRGAFETLPVLITAAGLDDLLHTGDPAPVVLDVRWRPGDPDGRAHYLKEHIPGPLYVDLDTGLSAPATAQSGRRPPPDPASLQSAARRWGISAGRTVVVHDDNGNTGAARAWWLLRWAGVEHVLLLDADAAADVARNGVLLDARAAERYRGDSEPVDSRL